MEAFLVSLATVALAELGDRTQLIALVLATRFRKPWPMIAAIFLSSVANHLLAGVIGLWIGNLLSPRLLDGLVGASLILMAPWGMTSANEEEEKVFTGTRVFVTTFVAFTLAELGDKTQIATMALAAGYRNLVAVVAGSVTAMMVANVPVVFAGAALASRIPVRQIRWIAAGLFVVLGLVFIARAVIGGH